MLRVSSCIYQRDAISGVGGCRLSKHLPMQESLYGLLDDGRASGRMHGCLDAAFHTELAASSRVVQLEFLRDFGHAVSTPNWNIKNLVSGDSSSLPASYV